MGYQHIDVSRISALLVQISGDRAACLRFVDDYLTGWERRQARVLAAVGGPVVDDALAALLSLSASSVMIGADGLGRAANELYLETRRLGAVPAPGAARLEGLGRAVCVELRHVMDDLRAA